MAVWTPMSAGLVAVTVTPGSMPPVLSATEPLMLPVVCAWDAVAENKNNIAPSSAVRKLFVMRGMLAVALHESSGAGPWDEKRAGPEAPPLLRMSLAPDGRLCVSAAIAD